MRNIYLFPLCVFLLTLSGCSSFVQKADYLPMQEEPQDAYPAPIQFSGYKLNLPVGYDVGIISDSANYCGWPHSMVGRNVIRDAFETKNLERAFVDALEGQGYDVVDNLTIAFDEEDEYARAEYKIKAHIQDIQIDACDHHPTIWNGFLLGRNGTDGELFLDVKWTLYDALRRTTVYTTRTQGYTKRRRPNQEGLELMITDAFEMAAHNLGASPEFHDFIFYGKKPNDQDAAKEKQRRDNRPRVFSPTQPVALAPQALSHEPFLENGERKRKTAVLIQSGAGHGSGFFITKQGHILTNAHVVGDALRVRVVTADKDEKLIGEVLRIDKARDVALIRLEKEPGDMEIIVLPIRTEWPTVGEDIYAIGTPKDFNHLQDTVTKGIISAHRMEMKFLGTRQNFIQGDVSVHSGSSGGPLLDAYGNIVAISVGAYTAGNNHGIGLNYFIPIAEALNKMDITVGGTPVDITP